LPRTDDPVVTERRLIILELDERYIAAGGALVLRDLYSDLSKVRILAPAMTGKQDDAVPAPKSREVVAQFALRRVEYLRRPRRRAAMTGGAAAC